MHSLHFGGGVTQDQKSREADTHTHYFHINDIKQEDLSLTWRVFFIYH